MYESLSGKACIINLGRKRILSIITLLLLGFSPYTTVEGSRIIQIDTKDQLLELIGNLQLSPSSSKPFPTTSDIEILVPIHISTGDIPFRLFQSKDVALGYSRPVNGVFCKNQKRFKGGNSCSEIALSPGIYRFRIYWVTGISLSPFLEVMSSSGEACREDEFRCESDNVCYSPFDQYCDMCLRRSPDKCVCLGHGGIVPDGSKCHVVSGDLRYEGTCLDGTCR
jgi:hypothetical protein